MNVVKVGETEFQIPPPKGMRSFALQQRIGPVVGNLIGAIVSVLDMPGIGDVSKLLDSDVSKALPSALPALGGVLASMPQGELETLTKELLRDAKVKMGGAWVQLFGGPASTEADDLFDTVMAGRSLDTWRLLWHAVRVWYPDFFALAALRKLGAAAGNDSKASTI